MLHLYVMISMNTIHHSHNTVNEVNNCDALFMCYIGRSTRAHEEESSSGW